MEHKEIYGAIKKQKQFLENIGYNVLYIGLFGSQNYKLDNENSDIDLRAIIMPTLEQVIKRDTISIKYETEIGDIDVKDVMTYYNVVRKGNFSFIEPMQTIWFIGDKKLREMFGEIRLNYMSLKGDMYSKAEAFRHPYPSKEKEISQWGYDPKQLHHIFRLIDLLQTKNDKVSFIEYDEKNAQFLKDVKINKNNIIQNLSHIDITSIDKIKEYIDFVCGKYIDKDYKYQPIDIKDNVVKYIENHLKKMIFKSPIQSAREQRTFNNGIPKDDLKKFPELKKYINKDICYIVYESLEIL